MLVRDRRLVMREFRRNGLEMEQFRTMLRENGIFSMFDVDDVRFETNGRITISRRNEPPESYLLVNGGKVMEDALERSGKGKRPEDYVVPPKEELEKLRYIPPEEERTARKLGEGADLSAMLDQYLGGNSAAGGETGEVRKPGRSRNRRRNRGGHKPEGTQQLGREENSGGGRERQQQPRQDKPKAQEQPKKERPAPQQATAPVQAEGNKSGGGKRRHRPYHRRSKKPGAGQGGTGEKQS